MFGVGVLLVHVRGFRLVYLALDIGLWCLVVVPYLWLKLVVHHLRIAFWKGFLHTGCAKRFPEFKGSENNKVDLVRRRKRLNRLQIYYMWQHETCINTPVDPVKNPCTSHKPPRHCVGVKFELVCGVFLGSAWGKKSLLLRRNSTLDELNLHKDPLSVVSTRLLQKPSKRPDNLQWLHKERRDVTYPFLPYYVVNYHCYRATIGKWSINQGKLSHSLHTVRISSTWTRTNYHPKHLSPPASQDDLVGDPEKIDPSPKRPQGSEICDDSNWKSIKERNLGSFLRAHTAMSTKQPPPDIFFFGNILVILIHSWLLQKVLDFLAGSSPFRVFYAPAACWEQF